MGDSNDAVSRNESSFHDVHVFPSDWVIQSEQLSVVVWDLQRSKLIHGASSLMGYVVDDEDAPGILHLIVLPVVCLHGGLQSRKNALASKVRAKPKRCTAAPMPRS